MEEVLSRTTDNIGMVLALIVYKALSGEHHRKGFFEQLKSLGRTNVLQNNPSCFTCDKCIVLGIPHF